MKIKHVYSGLILCTILSISCNQKIEKLSKLNVNQNLREGEWLDSSDTLNGISVRKNKMAFFKNMTFSSHDIFQYVIIDSIYKDQKTKRKIGEYLIVQNQDS